MSDKALLNEFSSVTVATIYSDRVYHESDYVSNYLENMYDSECLIDGNNVTLI